MAAHRTACRALANRTLSTRWPNRQSAHINCPRTGQFTHPATLCAESRIGPHKRSCRREGFSVHASIANYQNEALSNPTAMRPLRAPEPDLGPTALGAEEPFGRSSPTRRDRTAAEPRTRPCCSSHSRRPYPKESIPNQAPFESSVHCT